MWSLLLGLSACAPRPAPTTPVFTPEDTAEDTAHDTASIDGDGDGWDASDDCDDGNAGVFPGAEESCNETDDDCDRLVDEDSADWSTWYRDADGDGYGDSNETRIGCFAPEGYVSDASDCDDTVEGDQREADGDCLTYTFTADVTILTTGTYQNAATSDADLDGDGHPELVTGVFLWYTYSYPDGDSYLPPGEVQVFRGATFGASPALTLDDASLTLTGPALGSSESGEVVGTSLAVVADLDGGGCDDLLVGAYLGADGGGSVRLVMGENLPETGTVPIDDVASAEYRGDGWPIGTELVSADFDGDSIADVLIGDRATWLMPGAEPGAGVVNLPEVATSLPEGYLGDIGDLDGDGLDDLLIQPPCELGLGYLGATLGGADALTEADADFSLVPAYCGGRPFGRADVSGDGLPDVLAPDSYSTAVIYGTTLLDSRTFASNGEIFIHGSDAAGPVRMDGSVASLRMNLEDYDGWQSTCSILLTPPGGTFDRDDCFDTYTLDSPHDVTAWSTAGDITGDGTGELLLSVKEEDWDDALWVLFDRY